MACCVDCLNLQPRTSPESPIEVRVYSEPSGPVSRAPPVQDDDCAPQWLLCVVLQQAV